MITIHVVLSNSQQHVPTQFRFKDGMRAMDFGRDASLAENVYRVYGTNRDGAQLAGFYWEGVTYDGKTTL